MNADGTWALRRGHRAAGARPRRAVPPHRPPHRCTRSANPRRTRWPADHADGCRTPAVRSGAMAIELTSVPVRPRGARALRDAVVAAKAGDPLAPVTRGRAHELRRRGRRAACSAAACSGGSPTAGAASPASRSSPSTGSPSCSVRPGSPPRAGGRCRRPCSPPRCGRCSPTRRAGSARSPSTPPPRPRSSPRTASCRPSTTPRSTRSCAPVARAADVVRISRRVRASLAPEWYDERDLMDAAATEVGARACRCSPTSARSCVYLPQDLSQPAAALLRARRDATCRSRSSPAPPASTRADAPVARRAGSRRPRRSTPRSGRAARAATRASCRRPIPTTRCAPSVRLVVDALRDGVPLERMAVLYGAPEPYARLVHEQLDAAGIPHNGAAVRTLAESVLGRGLLGLLALPDRDFQRHDVMRAARRCAGLPPRAARCRGELGAHQPARPDRARRRALARAARAVRGASRGASWRRSARSPTATRARTGTSASSTRTRELEAFVADPACATSRVEPGRELARPGRRGPSGSSATTSPTSRAAARGPRPSSRPPRRSRPRSTASPGSTRSRPSPASTCSAARSSSSSTPTSAGSAASATGVLVGHVALGLGLDLDRVFVCGLAEGTVPRPRARRLAAPRRRPAAPPTARCRCAPAGSTTTTGACSPRSRARRASASCSSPRRPAPHHRARAVAVPARHASSRCGHAPAPPTTSLELHADWFTPVPSFAAGLARVEFPATEQEHRLRTLLDHAAAAARSTTHELARRRPRARARRRRASSRARARAFTRFDGNLAGLAVPRISRRRPWSCRRRGSRRWAVLPARLPAASTSCGSRSRSCPRSATSSRRSTAAACARDARRVPRRGPRPARGRARPRRRRGPTPTASGSARSPRRACAEYEAQGLTGRRLFWHRDRRRILAELDRFLTDDDDVRADSGLRTIATELRFGFSDERARGRAPALRRARAALPRRRRPRRRAPTAASLWVIDYKTGQADRRRPDDDPTVGRHAAAAPRVRARGAARRSATADTPVGAAYWFVEHARRASGGRSSCSTPTVDARVDEVLRAIVDGIEAGCSRAGSTRPTTWHAAVAQLRRPRRAGTRDRYREWVRKRERARAARLPGARRARRARTRRGGAGMTDRKRSSSRSLDLDEDARHAATRSSASSTTRCSSRRARARARPRRSSTGSSRWSCERGVPMRRDRRDHVHREGGGRAARPHPARAASTVAPTRRRGRRGAAPRSRSTSSTRPRSARCTRSRSASSPSTRSRPGCRRASRCSTRSRRSVAFEERWTRFVDELLDDPDARAHRSLLALERRHRRSTRCARSPLACNANWDLVAERMHAEPDPPPLDAALAPVLAELDELRALAAHCLRRPDDKLARRARRARPTWHASCSARARRVRAAAARSTQGAAEGRRDARAEGQLARRRATSTSCATG